MCVEQVEFDIHTQQQIDHKLNVTVHFACRKKFEVPSRLLYTSFGSRRPSTTTLSQPTTPYWALRYWLSTFGRWAFQSPVLLCGTLYRIISVIQHWVLTGLGNYLKQNYLQIIEHTQCSECSSWCHYWHCKYSWSFLKLSTKPFTWIILKLIDWAQLGYIVPLEVIVCVLGNRNALGVLYISYSVVDDHRHK